MRPRAEFPPTIEAARQRLAAVRPSEYARTRNHLEGAVTGLSPYFTHGLLSLPQALGELARRHRLDPQHKFVQELGWREFFHHVWAHRGQAILKSLHEGPLPEDAYARDLPADLLEGRTGVPVVDQAVRTLYATGYLHNHARMWLASYVVHVRKLHWRSGADWMVAHLLDGDLGSNHLSWQWVAGTGSHKPYVFNAGNVARYAPAEWHSPNTLVDASYEVMDAMALSPKRLPNRPTADGVTPPTVHGKPSEVPGAQAPGNAPDATAVAGRDVWLVHPWALGERPTDLPTSTLCVGVYLDECHTPHPWSERRWAFVGARMGALCPVVWSGPVAEVATALAAARSVHTLDNPHVSTHLRRLRLRPGAVRPAPTLFAPVDRPCASFSRWWRSATDGVNLLDELHGLRDSAQASLL